MGFLSQAYILDGNFGVLAAQATPEEVQAVALYLACVGLIVFAWNYWQASKREARRQHVKRLRQEQTARELAEYKRRNLIKSMKALDF